MANWILNQDGNAINLDMATQIICKDLKVTAYFACPSEADFGIDCLTIKTFDSEREAKEYIKHLINASYESPGQVLSQILA